MYFILSIIKILDNIILTAKSLATYKGQKILSSILVMISQLIFYLVIRQVANDDTTLAIIVVSVSSGIGNYLAFMINERFKKDDVWTNIITSNNSKMIISLCEMLKENNIKYLLYYTYNRKFNQSLTVTAYTKTKAESKLIDQYLSRQDAKYLRMIDGNEVKQ